MNKDSYDKWKGTTGPGRMLREILNPDGLEVSTTTRKAIANEYARYCESDEAPKYSGPCPIRAAKFAEIHNRLSKGKK